MLTPLFLVNINPLNFTSMFRSRKRRSIRRARAVRRSRSRRSRRVRRIKLSRGGYRI